MARSGIYAIRCIVNGKLYVGSAVNFSKRWSKHRIALDKGIHHSPALQSAWNKYGGDQFVFEVLEAVADKTDLLRIEQQWLDQLRSYEKRHGYNICPTAGSNLGKTASDETKAKMSAARKGRTANPEVGAKISASKMGFSPSPETRAKISITLKGRPLSQEIRNKMSVARKGKLCRKRGKQSPEVIAKRVAGMIGRKHSPEAIAKMRGRKMSPETLAKMSAAQLAWRAKRREDRTGKRQKLFDFPD